MKHLIHLIQIYNPTTSSLENCLDIFSSKKRHWDPSPFFWKSNRTPPPPIEKNLGNMSPPKTNSFPFEEPFNFSYSQLQLQSCLWSQPFLHPNFIRTLPALPHPASLQPLCCAPSFVHHEWSAQRSFSWDGGCCPRQLKEDVPRRWNICIYNGTYDIWYIYIYRDRYKYIYIYMYI